MSKVTTFVLFALISMASTLHLHAGYVNLSFTDFSRGRLVECVVYYPSFKDFQIDTSESAPIAFATHLVGFIGGRNMHWSYYGPVIYAYGASSITVIPKSYMDNSVPDSVVAFDLIACLNFLHDENTHPGYPFYGHVPLPTFIGGHSTGAAIAILAARYAGQGATDPIEGNILFSPTGLTSTIFKAAHAIPQRTLILAGTNDCVAPGNANASQLYDSLTTSCRTLVLLPGAAHCQWTTACPNCTLLEKSCASRLSANAHDFFLFQYYSSFTDNIDQWCKSSIFKPDTVTTVRTTSVTHDQIFVHATKDRACVGDSVTFFSDSVYSNYLWLPDSVRTSTYSVKAKNSLAVTLIVNESCFSFSGGFHLVVAEAEKVLVPRTASLCNGSPAQLKVSNASVYSTIEWSTGQTGSAINVTNPGTYTVRALDPRTCSYATDSVVVSTFTPFSKSLQQKVLSMECDSQEVISVEPAVSRRGTFQWSNGSRAFTLVLDKDGGYTVWLMSEDSVSHCISFSDTVDVTVNSAPRRAAYPRPIVTQTGTTLTSTIANTYQWTRNGNIIPGATEQSVTMTESGRYAVVVTYDAIKQCARESFSINYINTEVLDTSEPIQIILSGTMLHIRSHSAAEKPIALYSLLGECVLKRVTTEQDIAIDLHLLRDGVYLVDCDGAKKSVVLVR